MKNENTAIRLKKIMNERNLRQVDILNLTLPYCKKYNIKMNKSDLSQYCSGKTEPNQDKLFVLSIALNVNEAWLMGFDVPMERKDNIISCDDNIIKSFAGKPDMEINRHIYYSLSDKSELVERTKKYDSLLEEFDKMNKRGKHRLLETAREMNCSPLYNDDYQAELNAAHERTDIDITDEMKEHDDNLMDDNSEWN